MFFLESYLHVICINKKNVLYKCILSAISYFFTHLSIGLTYICNLIILLFFKYG